jgi:hypothetical protein
MDCVHRLLDEMLNHKPVTQEVSHSPEHTDYGSPDQPVHMENTSKLTHNDPPVLQRTLSPAPHVVTLQRKSEKKKSIAELFQVTLA